MQGGSLVSGVLPGRAAERQRILSWVMIEFLCIAEAEHCCPCTYLLYNILLGSMALTYSIVDVLPRSNS